MGTSGEIKRKNTLLQIKVLTVNLKLNALNRTY